MERTGRQAVLDILKGSSVTTSGLADATGLAEPTVRRKIQQLRADGHNIVYVNGYATLRPAEQLELAGQSV